MEFIGILILYFLGVFFAAGFFVLVRADRRSVGLARSWQAYAARHRYDFARGRGPDKAFRIRGSREGIAFLLETDTTRRLVTRLVAPAASGADRRVVAALGAGRGSDSDGSRTPTGDVPFDQRFDVRASDARAVEAVLRPEVRQALQRFPTPMIGAGLKLVVDDGEVVVEWAGGEVDPMVLDAAHAILQEVCAPSNHATATELRPMGV